jgi:hypothetical protein
VMLSEDNGSDFGIGSNVSPKRRSPCSDLVVSFLSVLSKSILSHRESKQFPDLVTFAFFCRTSSIRRIKSTYVDSQVRLGLGVALHIAPANVPINLAFTFVFGLLSGNSNVVRMPTKTWPQIDLFLEIYNKVSCLDDFVEIREENTFIRTKHDSVELIELVSEVDALVVWGGDATVAHFRSMQKKPRCVELYFPNRTSSLVIDTKYICALNESGLKDLVNNFYNDTYLVDQNACSSPLKIGWVGDNSSISIAKESFFRELKTLLSNKLYFLDPVARIDRYIDVMYDAQNACSSMVLDQIGTDIWLQKEKVLTNGRFGRYHSYDLAAFSDFIPYLSDDQTLSHCGFSSEDLRAELMDTGSCVDRIVPVGKALNIGIIWDGVNLLSRLSRIVSVN